jgi:Family of unknown function (DUF6152)
MTTRKFLRFTALMILGSALPVMAHHSVTAEFDPNKRITLKGTVTKVDWQNPHIFFHIDVKDASGKITTWELQSLPPAFFRGSGLTRQKILADTEEVTVTAYPAKDGTAAYGYLLTLTYPDGRTFNLSREGVTGPPGK